MRTFRAVLGLFLLATLVACSSPSKIKTYDGPPVTQVVIKKAERKMYLFINDTQVLKTYDVGLGNEPVGPKRFEGDGRTPEGVYFVDRFNPDSRYYLSVGISYPNAQDSARAGALGMSAGGDIFIHGRGPEGNALVKQRRDWTAGCIAVKDKEVEDIYAMLRPGVPIVIYP
ncbi:L,D-transpeptidase family protein [uncultured Paracoccus sp.]|uniref:L,D-transpeptidase family protein n=1 Tax=uncultured Paracoccus sp. TaxID=189685 RepID=UPI0026206073|nr:L,D-transpeptidase family protein [uncultured Paracoccus sp.]